MIIPISIVIPYTVHEDGISAWTQVRETKDTFHKLLEFPGGKIEANETPVAAANREVLEETGVTLQEKDIIKFKNYQFELAGNTILLMTYLFEDKESLFKESGRYRLDYLVDNPDIMPVKNIEIILDLVEWFQ